MSETNDQTVSLDATQAIAGPVTDKTQMSVGVNCPVCSAVNNPSEIYCTDCGFLLSESPVEDTAIPEVTNAKLISADGTREFTLKEGSNSVGRKDADILLSDGSVSRNHAVIEVSGGNVEIKDLGSTNGTQVDSKTIVANEITSLTDGCKVRFGSVTLKYVAAPKLDPEGDTQEIIDEEETETPQAGDSSIDMNDISSQEDPETATLYGTLTVKGGSESYPIEKSPITIGRKESNDIVVNDPYCSGSHAKLERIEKAIYILDLDSSNGTLVNGVAIEPQQPILLSEGDELTIGQTTLLFTEVMIEQ